MDKRNNFVRAIFTFVLAFVFMMGTVRTNADALTATGTLKVGSSVDVTLNNSTMVYYKVTPTKTETYSFSVISKVTGSQTTTNMRLYDANAKLFKDTTGRGSATIKAYMAKGTTYYIGVMLSGQTTSESMTLSMALSDVKLVSVKYTNVVNAKDSNYVALTDTSISGVTFDNAANVLTLNGLNGAYAFKVSLNRDVVNTLDSTDFVIDVKTTNTLTGLSDAFEFGGGINAIFSGDGLLNIIGNGTENAISAKGDVTVDGANLNISGDFKDECISCRNFYLKSGSVGFVIEADKETSGHGRNQTSVSSYESAIEAQKSIEITGGTIFIKYSDVISGTTVGDVDTALSCSGTISISNANIVVTGPSDVLAKAKTYSDKAKATVDTSTVNIISGTSINIKYLTLCLSQYYYTYDGKAKKPTATISGLTLGTDFTVSYKNNKKVGTATVTATGKGNYTGTLKATFVISQKKGSVITDKKYKYKVTKVVAADGTPGFVMVTGLKKTSLTQIKIAAKVTINGSPYFVRSIKKNAFKNNTKIKKITIGKRVKTIGNYAFAGCKKVTKLVINSTVLTKIGVGAFKNEKKLKTAVIKSTKLKTIGKKAFFGDKKLKTLKMKTTKLTTVGTKALYRAGGVKLTIKVPSSKKSAYKKKFKKAKTNKYVVKAI